MAISSMDGLVNALANGVQIFPINKASVSGTTGNSTSLWRSAGNPSQAAIPTTAAICNNTLLGAFPYNVGASMNTHVGRGAMVSSVSGLDVFIMDRLGHRGGLVGNVTTAQAVDLDVTGSTSNLEDRIGQADCGEVEWWLEWYTATGSTAATATVTYTNQADVTGRTTTVALAATRPIGNMLPIMPNTADTAIKSVQSVQLSVSTGTAGNFGVTATRAITSLSLGIAYTTTVADWMYVGLARVRDEACIMMRAVSTTTSTGTLAGNIRLIQG